MLNKLKITYLFESTTLWGGNKVGFEQAEALSEIGHDVTILSKDTGPTWYKLSLPVIQVSNFDSTTIPDSDIIVGTFWTTIRAAHESKKGIFVHLCQGYEAANKELLHLKHKIDEVYSYNIPKLTVSPHLNSFLKDRFHAETYYIGHMLNRDIFYPSEHYMKGSFSFKSLKKIIHSFKTNREEKQFNPLKILVVGPFEADVKNIATTLKGISLVEKRFKLSIKLIRVSQFPLTHDEEIIRKPDVYHFHVPYHNMGEIYRNADVFISMSKEAEGFGLPAMEAMGCGIPTILSKISSYTSFDETPDYALFVESSDYESLAEKISEISQNRSLREKLIEQGLTVADKFTKEKVVDRLNNAFETILNKNKLSKIKKTWNDYHNIQKSKPQMFWWDSSVIMEHCQKLVTGDPEMNIYQFLKKEFVMKPLEKGLSICSGSGEFERGVLDNNICSSIDAYEIAEERVKEGIRVAQEKNYAINFYIEDVNRAIFKNNYYDIFFSWAALHHIENLEGVCENVRNALKDGGLVVVQEFVGPNQFQWTDKQIEIANQVLHILPERLRINPKTGEVITHVERPTIEYMNSTDPSEAIRARDIIPILNKFFVIKTIRYFGGSFYNILFNGIIGNFSHDDEKDVALIKMILLMEEILTKENILDNDYVVIIAEKRG
ncbi:MAG: glycosyltransferase [Nitrospirota bacterium]